MRDDTSPPTAPSPRAAPPREIGSDFETVDPAFLRAAVAQSLPWESTESTWYVQSGRQALMLVQETLRSAGHHVVHVASFVCDSVVQAFTANGWTVRQIPVNRDLVVEPATLEARVTEGVLLHTPYFGREDSSAMTSTLLSLRERGVTVVADETHRIFSAPSAVADFRVASLRKLLPVYDGGYVCSTGTPMRAPEPTDPDLAALRERAMRTKSLALRAGRPDDTHRGLFAAAEDALERATSPRLISPESFEILRHLDLDRMRSVRTRNAAALARALGEERRYRVINPPSANLLPSHLVLETDHPHALRKWMTEDRIYCPIHWPPCELLPRVGPWPDRYLSIPVDHRYDDADMARIAARLLAFFEQTERTRP